APARWRIRASPSGRRLARRRAGTGDRGPSGRRPGRSIGRFPTRFRDTNQRWRDSSMIHAIVRFSIERPGLVAGIAAALGLLGLFAARNLPKDALPDFGETHGVVDSGWDRERSLLESQVTYPIVTRLMSMPGVKTVRGISDFGRSFVYAVFEDGADLNRARNSVQQYLTEVTSSLPAGVKTRIGPDGTGLGWIFQYVVADRNGHRSLAEL